MAPEPSHRPRHILSLDGGGVRGYSSILILERLMKIYNGPLPEEKKLQPWELFDLIGGTSTGGLIAVMIGLLHMPIEDCKNAYKDLSVKVFQRRRSPANVVGRFADKFGGKGKFSAKKFEEVVASMVKDRKGDAEYKMQDEKNPARQSDPKVYVLY